LRRWWRGATEPQLHRAVRVPDDVDGPRRVRAEVERQMQLIVEKFRPALEGDFAGWPVE
jgi:hypothetical protein